MAEKDTVVIGCDINSGQDSEFQDTVASRLESAGYTVEKLPIAPGPFAEYSYSSNAQGKIGVYIIAAGTYSIADYHYGANANKQSFKLGVFPIRTDLNSKLQGDDWDNVPIGGDPDFSGLPTDIIGKTFKQMNEMLKDDVRIVRGNTPDEMANNVLKAIGGQVQSDGESEPSTIKEAIKDVLSGWEGEVEAYVRDMTMYIHKIKLPEQNTYLLLSEQHNIEKGSVTIKDYCPNNKNKLIVHWSGGEDIIIQDNKRIERFGEKEWELEATKKVLKEEAPEETKSSDDSKTSDTSNDSENSDSSKTTDDSKKTEENNSVGYVEVPVETEEEALEFAHLEWNKNKRECCHEIELSTIGSDRWEIGRWCYVYLPSFEIEEYYYISRASSNISPNEWKTSLTLVPYPPKVENEIKEESEENSDEETTEDETKTNDENSISSSTSDE